MITSGLSVSTKQWRSATLLTTDWKLTFKIFSFCGALLVHLFCWSFDLKGLEVTGQWVGSYLRCGGLTACHQNVQCWNLAVHNWGTPMKSFRVRTTICASQHPSLHTRCDTTAHSFHISQAILLLLLLYLRAPPLIYSRHKSVDLKYWLVYNKSSVLVIIIYTWCSKYIQLLITDFVGSLELSQCHHSFHM